ncbi:hypothetical protein RHSIM_Rhsim05G0144100 [Rhododendron simsii]|uniref:RING-type domain-containing protein n=1 Tax=Rhododendron simsii TaxID=118357 RepID=A0A834LP19_RHOSS|nr:hypothetical protein RHSIM_Rhsim05G0144100 [Rhododendron simsii]
MAEDKASGSAASPCPSCLGPFLQESYLDHCFHNFCYNCIVRWAKVVAGKHSRQPSPSVKCPLCRTENFSVIHGYDGNSFRRHYINRDFASSPFFSEVHKYRLQCYNTEPDGLIDTFKVPQGGIEDVEIIVHHILGVIDSLRRNEHQNSLSTVERREETFKALVCQAARPFLAGRSRTNRFVDEEELFRASGLNTDAYDKVYMQHLGWIPPGITTEGIDGESTANSPLVPFVYIFDDDSDGNE